MIRGRRRPEGFKVWQCDSMAVEHAAGGCRPHCRAASAQCGIKRATSLLDGIG